MSKLYSYREYKPNVANDVFIAAGAIIIGDVEISKECSIWYNTIIRGDVNSIRIGRMTNIQDNSTIHSSSGRIQGTRGIATIIGEQVTVGHNSILHACTINDGCLIGMGSILLDGSVIGKGSIIGAGAVVLKGAIIPPFSVVVGSPAKVIKTLDESTFPSRLEQAEYYYHLSRENMLNHLL